MRSNHYIHEKHYSGAFVHSEFHGCRAGATNRLVSVVWPHSIMKYGYHFTCVHLANQSPSRFECPWNGGCRWAQSRFGLPPHTAMMSEVELTGCLVQCSSGGMIESVARSSMGTFLNGSSCQVSFSSPSSDNFDLISPQQELWGQQELAAQVANMLSNCEYIAIDQPRMLAACGVHVRCSSNSGYGREWRMTPVLLSHCLALHCCPASRKQYLQQPAAACGCKILKHMQWLWPQLLSGGLGDGFAVAASWKPNSAAIQTTF